MSIRFQFCCRSHAGMRPLVNHCSTVTYLPEEDILSVELVPARPAITVEIGDGGLVRLDVETGTVIAFEILNFKERLGSGVTLH